MDERGRIRGERARGPARAGRPARRERAPQLGRARSRAGGVVAVTTGLLGLSSTRRAAVLAIVMCALALTVAVPLRNFVAQRQELAAVSEEQRTLAAEVDALTRERQRLLDPAEVAAEARGRLGYVAPGETPYVVQFPSAALTGPDPGPADGTVWFQRLWREIAEGSR